MKTIAGSAALEDSEMRFRALVTAGSYAVYRMSADWRRMYRLDGQGFLADTAAPSEDWVQTYIVPEDRAAVGEAIARAVADRDTFELEHRIRRADGGVGWTLSRAIPIMDEAGEIREWFGAASDVTARRSAEEALRRSEERLTVLVSELQHRTRNLLAVVSGVADRTRAGVKTLDAFGAAFDGRLAALGRAHCLLARATAPAVNLADLVLAELDAHGLGPHDEAAAASAAGPDVALPADAAQLLALALNELATNAVKHGAVGRGGRIDVAWEKRGERLLLDWRESGGRPTALHEDRRGFGRELIEVNLPYELDARTELTLGPDGARCRIDLPFPAGLA